MSEREQNTGEQKTEKTGRVLGCDQWEDLIADALDGTLNQADAAAFARHQDECALCAQMFKEAHQGKDWMEYLAVEPEVPADMLQKILARTSEIPGAGVASGDPAGIAAMGHSVNARPAWQRMAPHLVPITRHVFEPRLMMTVAMAFFSIALTLNLTGIKLTEIRAADLHPSRVRANLTRQYYSTNEQVMKYYENLRLVYEMEARVRELRRTPESAPRSVPPSAPPSSLDDSPKRSPRDGGGASPSGQAQPQHRNQKEDQHEDQDRRTHLQGDVLSPVEMVHAAPQQPVMPQVVPQAESEFPRQAPASFEPEFRPEFRPGFEPGKSKREVFRALHSTTEDQAERSLV